MKFPSFMMMIMIRPVLIIFLFSGQDFPSQPSGWAVIISLFNYNLMNGYSAMAVPFIDELV